MSDLFDYLKPMMPKFEPPEPPYSPRQMMYAMQMPVIQRPHALVKCGLDTSLLPSLEVRTSAYLTERKQVVFPKGKRKRIQKKFRKNPANWADVPSEKIMVMGTMVMMHPATLEILKAELETVNHGSQPGSSRAIAEVHEGVQEAAIERIRRALGA
jgi:hypothetical protein